MFRENSINESSENLSNCPNCDISAIDKNGSKKSKKLWIALVCIVLSAALVLSAVAFWFFDEDSAFERLASSSIKTFSSPVKITASGLYDLDIGLFDEQSIEIIIPEALSEGHFAVSAGGLGYYRKSGYEYYYTYGSDYGSEAGVFRKISPDSDSLISDTDIGKYLDYFINIANGDYRALAELINDEDFDDDIVSVGKFVNRASEIIDTYFSDEYMAENYGFVYSNTSEGEKYSFALSYSTVLQTLKKIVEGSKECFSDIEKYNEILDELNNLLDRGFGDEMFFDIDVLVKEGVFSSIKTDISEHGKTVSIALDFSEYGTAKVSEELISSFDERKEQLGSKDYLVWYGAISYSDYYKKD